ncbi:MAG TPA: 2-phosphoglycerate kinase [Actinomycetota bacterium]|jgi:2-phosphoglycerate kinase|nr:2-phosphoglycerate kinase [Actinomycetota bacterium]
MTRGKRNTHIIISDRDPGLPYSKGLMASQVMVSGLSPYRSYKVAERIEDELVERGVRSLTTEELQALAVRMIEEEAGERYARNFVRWQGVVRLDIPLVLLIGGATGVGKSTIATQIAARLGVVRVIPSDSVREVMRGLFSRELMPTLYTSSFDADSALREPPARAADRVIVGFREQTAAVAVGLRALIERSAIEGTSSIIEGAHVVPGFLDLDRFADRVLSVPVVVTVEDEEVHRSHFQARSADSAARPFDRYLSNFDNIRRVQKYIKSQALSHDWPVIASYNLDQTIAAIIDLVVDSATERLAREGAPLPEPVLELEGGKTR